jgi:hypothetical protein
MVAHELSMGLEGGYVINDKPLSKKEKKFIERHNLELIDMSLEAFTNEFI